MREYTQVEISPRDENLYAQMYTAFGWQLESAQEFYSENTYATGGKIEIKGDSGKITVNRKTDVTNYVTLRFSREKDIPRYYELTEKENEFMRLARIPSAVKPNKRLTVLGVAIWVLIIVAIYSFSTGDFQYSGLMLIDIGIIAVMSVLTMIGYKKYKEHRRLNMCARARMRDLVIEAQEILEECY